MGELNFSLMHENLAAQKQNFTSQLTSLAKSQKALEAHGRKPWLTNLSMIPHTLGMLTANITYCIILLEYVNESHSSECSHNRFLFEGGPN